MTAAKRAERDELIAKDKRIDDLVEQAEELVTDLNTTVADMKRILAAAQANAEMQEQIREEGRGQR
jgi:hypothetical protein